jgi:hypothetical protein
MVLGVLRVQKVLRVPVRKVPKVLAVLEVLVLVLGGLLIGTSAAFAQDPHAGMQHEAPARTWTFMQDAVVFAMYNQQDSTRGDREVKAPNWWMGMAQRPLARGTLTLNLMLSLDPLTVGKQGYSHIMQVGETYEGNALIDHQHPHDFLMQAAAVGRRPLANGVALTLAGAPVGEPALGPIAFMHRASAAENPMSPLGHHTFDSTHIAMGVLTAGLDRGPFQIESSVFRGREPDEDRWDLMDPGKLDSWSVRGWYRPSPAWRFQISHGYLTQPETLEDGDVRRTTASGSWRTPRGGGSTAVTVAWGRNQKLGGSYDAFLAELTRSYGDAATIFWRVESTQVETDVLRTGVHIFQGGRKFAHVVEEGRRDFVGAFSLGATKTFVRPASWNVAAGGMVTGYAVPAALAPFYGSRPPVSFQIFVRVRPPVRHRMLDMTMTRPHGA